VIVVSLYCQDRARAHAQLLAALQVDYFVPHGRLHAAADVVLWQPTLFPQAAQRAVDDITAIPSRIKPPAAASAEAQEVSLESDVDWSKFTVESEKIAYRRFLQVRTEIRRVALSSANSITCCTGQQQSRSLS
jgi:hypothetical protein